MDLPGPQQGTHTLFGAGELGPSRNGIENAAPGPTRLDDAVVTVKSGKHTAMARVLDALA